MKNIKRLVLGFLSSALLLVGFARAADKLDPLANESQNGASTPMIAAPDSTSYCNFDDSQR